MFRVDSEIGAIIGRGLKTRDKQTVRQSRESSNAKHWQWFCIKVGVVSIAFVGGINYIECDQSLNVWLWAPKPYDDCLSSKSVLCMWFRHKYNRRSLRWHIRANVWQTFQCEQHLRVSVMTRSVHGVSGGHLCRGESAVLCGRAPVGLTRGPVRDLLLSVFSEAVIALIVTAITVNAKLLVPAMNSIKKLSLNSTLRL